MPEFKLNKLIRDKLPDEYERLGQVACYRRLSVDEHKIALIDKIAEEARELRASNSDIDIKSEIADIQQVINDLVELCNINPADIEICMKQKYLKKGGFKNAIFIETIKLNNDDEWIEYYRSNPETFPEV